MTDAPEGGSPSAAQDTAPDERGGLRGAVASTIDLPRTPQEQPPMGDAPRPGPGAPPPPKPKRKKHHHWILGTIVLGAVLALLLPVIFIAVLAGPLSGGSPATGGDCTASASDQTLPANLGAPGQLGGIAGTGITEQDLANVRHSPYASSRITPGDYVSTAYGPPWGGIQGAGNQTSGGLKINKGSPQKYFIAVDPKLIGHGTWVYVWPNPFGWAGPFLAADTGGAIVQHRIDFYDWRGRATQYGWGRRVVKASARPLAAGGGGAPTASAAPVAGAGDPTVAAGSSCGMVLSVGGSWGGVTGAVEVAPGANLPGHPVQLVVLEFLRGVAGRANRKIVVTTGTNHTKYVLGTNNVSDHYTGMAADLGAGGNHFAINGTGGTQIAAAAMATAGVPAQEAYRLADGGGGHNMCSTAPDGTVWRVQVLWRTYTGGNHYNHVHVGLRKGCTFKGVVSFS